jgi:hypothetical protein
MEEQDAAYQESLEADRRKEAAALEERRQQEEAARVCVLLAIAYYAG